VHGVAHRQVSEGALDPPGPLTIESPDAHDGSANLGAAQVVRSYEVDMDAHRLADAQPVWRPAAALLLATLLVTTGAAQRDAASPELKPYPGAVKWCSGSVIGAPAPDGTPGAHIVWTRYYSVDPLEKVVAHYLGGLGSQNHRKESIGDLWRFPIDRPSNVLSVTAAADRPPANSCKALPAAARTVVEISSSSRP
jgi:hypothetical protein